MKYVIYLYRSYCFVTQTIKISSAYICILLSENSTSPNNRESPILVDSFQVPKFCSLIIKKFSFFLYFDLILLHLIYYYLINDYGDKFYQYSN